VPPPDSPVHRYHDGTKHHFKRFARSLGYLDWASQPNPFRSYAGAPRVPLYPAPGAPGPGANVDGVLPEVAYDDMFNGMVAPAPLSPLTVGDLLRHSLGVSAWKRAGASRWSLRVNPSSGNLHPTEAYIVFGPDARIVDSGAVCHYAADTHAIEVRCRFDGDAWTAVSAGQPMVLVALTSIHWRESWKYGERAFRYCQHDLGHAIAAVTLAAAIGGWRAAMLPSWSQQAIARLVGLDREEDFVEAEREEPGCLLALSTATIPGSWSHRADTLLRAVGNGQWSGRASQLSEDHVQWTFIDDIARVTEDHGRDMQEGSARGHASAAAGANWRDGQDGQEGQEGTVRHQASGAKKHAQDARALVLRRRSAVAFRPEPPPLDQERFFAMLARVMPAGNTPWQALWWTPRIHLVLYVHRVGGVTPGLYLLGREAEGFARLQAAIGGHFVREAAHPVLPFIRLASGDLRQVAARVSCDQAIAGDGFFSLGMIADFDAALEAGGPAFYRHLFWEAGVVGQILYLEAEAAGVRATGIGCFYDDAVHDMLGLAGHAFQSLYHFTVGLAIDDPRLTTTPGYAWESC
jgi:SagB-type dehydrogenase family enzyme